MVRKRLTRSKNCAIVKLGAIASFCSRGNNRCVLDKDEWIVTFGVRAGHQLFIFVPYDTNESKVRRGVAPGRTRERQEWLHFTPLTSQRKG